MSMQSALKEKLNQWQEQIDNRKRDVETENREGKCSGWKHRVEMNHTFEGLMDTLDMVGEGVSEPDECQEKLAKQERKEESGKKEKNSQWYPHTNTNRQRCL